MINIGFSGWAGCGKTQAADYLVKKYGYNRISFADGIKEIALNYFNMQGKDRLLLQQIGEKMREIDSDIWVNHTIHRAKETTVIDDLRRKNEYDKLIENKFIAIRINSDEDIRIKRLMDRDGKVDVSLLYNESENGCVDIPMIEIDNNGTLEEFYSQIDSFMKQFLN